MHSIAARQRGPPPLTLRRSPASCADHEPHGPPPSPVDGDWTSVDVHGHRPDRASFAAPSTDVHRSPPPSVAYISSAVRYTSRTVTPAVTPTRQILPLENAVTRANATPTMPGFDSPQLHFSRGIEPLHPALRVAKHGLTWPNVSDSDHSVRDSASGIGNRTPPYSGPSNTGGNPLTRTFARVCRRKEMRYSRGNSRADSTDVR